MDSQSKQLLDYKFSSTYSTAMFVFNHSRSMMFSHHHFFILGIGVAAKGKKPGVSVFACEVDTAAPLSASLQAGHRVPCTYTASFVDGMGSGEVTHFS